MVIGYTLSGIRLQMKRNGRERDTPVSNRLLHYAVGECERGCRMAKSVMVMGTSSHVGKSILVTALCRILRQDGWVVSPFKVQNMSRNSSVTAEGLELSRAQAVQAEAAKTPPSAHMNPILLKPMDGRASQVIVQGRVHSNQPASSYMHAEKADLWQAAIESYQYLAERYAVIVLEGAGSPVEMNLKAHDLTNMKAAEMANAPVLLVADIERGGVFASIIGTLNLLEPHERKRVCGIVINKFRGDPTLFDDGIRFLEENTGIPVLGVLPYLPDLGVDEEDSLGLTSPRYRSTAKAGARVAIIPLPHLANFADVDALFLEPDIVPFFCRTPDDLQAADAAIIPGTKNTMDDLVWLKTHGWADALGRLRSLGGPVLGICGGYQMLGTSVRDPDGLESMQREVLGLGWLPIETTLAAPKRTVWVRGHLSESWGGHSIAGYEIHMGRSYRTDDIRALAEVREGEGEPTHLEGAVSGDKNVVGTYLHGILDNLGFRAAWLNHVRHTVGLPQGVSGISMEEVHEEAYERLATMVRGHLRLDLVYQAMGL